MYSECKQYLLGKLLEAGLKSKPYTTRKSLERSLESHVGAVLFEAESIRRNGSKQLFVDQTGARKKRRKIFDRGITFSVVIGDYTEDAVEAMFGTYLASLDKGITVAGNFIPIEVDGADWVDDDDSILKAKVAVQIKIRFDGGVYKDTGFSRLQDIEIVSAEKERSL